MIARVSVTLNTEALFGRCRARSSKPADGPIRYRWVRPPRASASKLFNGHRLLAGRLPCTGAVDLFPKTDNAFQPRTQRVDADLNPRCADGTAARRISVVQVSERLLRLILQLTGRDRQTEPVLRGRQRARCIGRERARWIVGFVEVQNHRSVRFGLRIQET